MSQSDGNLVPVGSLAVGTQFTVVQSIDEAVHRRFAVSFVP